MNRLDAQDLALHQRGLELAATAIDFELTPFETAELEGHIATCSACARRATALRMDDEVMRRPLGILPSPRVDAAVHAAIVRRSARPQRLLMLAAAALVLLGLLGAVTVGASILRTYESLPLTVAPSPSPSALLAESSPATPSPSLPPSGPVDTTLDPVILMRVNVSSDTGGPSYPSMTLYRDGTILNQDGRITRLTAAGVERMTSEAATSGLFAQSGELGFEPGYVGGGADAVIELRRGDEMIRRSTPLAMAEATRAEAERILALAYRLIDHESWLPADAWAVEPVSATPYAPSHFLVQITIEPGADPPGLLDIADVEWPLPGRVETFGVELGESPFSPATARCGVITYPEGQAVERAIDARRWDGDLDAGRSLARLAWAATDRRVTIGLVAPLPGERLECPDDVSSWPWP